MPWQSKAQIRYMFAKHPKIAKKWGDEGYIGKGLPEHKKKKKDEEKTRERAYKMLARKAK